MTRQNTSFFASLTELPWWVSIAVAAMVYVGLTHVLPKIETGNPYIDMLFKASAYAAPIFTMMFLVASPFAFFNARRKRRLVDEQTSLESIKALSWKEFEELVAEAFRRRGFDVVENGYGPDGGVDLHLVKNNLATIVQCRQWRNRNVGVRVIREMFGVLTANSANEVKIICCGGFTREATSFASDKPIQLIGGTELLHMVKSVQLDSREADISSIEENSTKVVNNVCPKCGSLLVKRQAKKGVNAGNYFLGCESFPVCRYVTDIQ